MSKRKRKTQRSIARDRTARATRSSSRDPLQVQISATVQVPKGRKLRARVIQEAIRHRIDTGRDPRGIKLRIVRWRNPTRKVPALRNWRSGNQADAWRTLGRALRSARVDVITVRNRGRGGA